MLKRIKVEQLKTGMFLQELAGSWMDSPFWRNKFLLRDPADIQLIRNSGIKEAWIDISRGEDVADGGGVHEADAREEIENELEFLASMPMPMLDEPSLEADPLQQAAAIYRMSKPLMKEMFHEARLGKVTVEQCAPLVEEISRSVMANPGALISIVRLKTVDEYTYMHSVAVCALMVGLARQLKMSEKFVREAGMAGMLHDLGKAQIPTALINKPGKLTDEEFALIRQHPERGHAMLVESGSASTAVLDVCLHHHEKVDGTGYPAGLKGDQLSLLARMGSICDVYDAVTSARSYKPAWNPGEALRKMAQWKGHFDPIVFQAFVKTVGIYPIGALVRLHSGRLAVVTEQSSHTLLKPKVNVFFDANKGQRIPPEVIDLGGPWTQDKVVSCEDPEKWGFSNLDKLWGAPELS